ncbi:VOC family protein [candidate division KSB1 bacterium]|nr:VOC family protein [candidate division KSB1 bacterium]
MPTQVDHFAFRVTELDRAIKFYQDILGLRLISKTVDEDHHEAFAFLELEGGNLELLQLLDENNQLIPSENSEVKEPYCPHLALKCGNLDQFVLELEDKKIEIVKGPLEIPGMVKWLYITDPDNNIIEFVEWIK